MPAMRIAVVVHDSRAEATAFAATLEKVARDKGLKLVPPRADDRPEMVIAVGGDGTMLRAVRLGLALDVPVLGFNLGHLGFLAEAEPSELDVVFDALADNKHEIRKRMTIEASLSNGSHHLGVNDVVVEKIESQRLVALAVDIDSERYHTYRADGLVVSTPTGSSAYNFSAGGPLVDPQLEAIVLTPVAAHSLFSRSLVLSPASNIRLAVTADRPVRVSVDGLEVGTLTQGDWVLVRRGPRPARFVSFAGRTFPMTVRDKFQLEP